MQNIEVQDGNELKEVKEKTAAIRHYKDLLVYQQAYRLALQVSSLTKTFPRPSVSQRQNSKGT